MAFFIEEEYFLVVFRIHFTQLLPGKTLSDT